MNSRLRLKSLRLPTNCSSAFLGKQSPGVSKGPLVPYCMGAAESRTISPPTKVFKIFAFLIPSGRIEKRSSHYEPEEVAFAPDIFMT